MAIIVPSNHTRIGAWVNSKMSGNVRHGKHGLQLNLLHYIKRIGWVSMKGIYK